MSLTFISKEHSQALKGCALFMMVFLHLFNQTSNLQTTFSLCEIDGVPLVNFMARGMGPVEFYLFLSGYGLYYIFKSKKLTGGGNLARLAKLMIIYWLSLIVFVTIGSFIKPDVYPGNILDLVQNITSFRTTYNGEAWFLFPYILTLLTCGALFKILDRYKGLIVYIVCVFIYFGSCFLISRYYASYFDSHYAIYHVVLYMSFLLPFMSGAIFCKYADKEYRGAYIRWLNSIPQWVLVVALLMLYISRCIVSSAAYSPFYVCLFIILFLRIRWWNWIERCMMFLGKFSTSVWLIHTWFCYYLFHDFIYGFHYPILILIVEFAVSIMSGYVIQKIAKVAYRVVKL